MTVLQQQLHKEISLSESDGWRWLTHRRDNNEQRFPGLEVQAEHADKSHKLKGEPAQAPALLAVADQEGSQLFASAMQASD